MKNLNIFYRILISNLTIFLWFVASAEQVNITWTSNGLNELFSETTNWNPSSIDLHLKDKYFAIFGPIGSTTIVDGGPFAKWMGPRRSLSPVRDMGNSEWSYSKIGDYGIQINRGISSPRASGRASDMGAYEFFMNQEELCHSIDFNYFEFLINFKKFRLTTKYYF